MARPLRLEHAGAVWHATSRGNDRSPIFLDDRDRERFLEVLAKVVDTVRWRLHAFVLMGNHYHLLVETPEPNLSVGMRQVNGLYGQGFNRAHGRTGHLFQGRFKGILVQRDTHLLEVCRYVVLNPVRASLAASAEEWPWSSYPYTVGTKPAPAWLDTSWTLSQFGDSRARARARYRAFVKEGEAKGDSLWDRLQGQVFLGSDGFREEVEKTVHSSPTTGKTREVPFPQRAFLRPTLEGLVAAVAREYGLTPEELKASRDLEPRALLAWLARHDGCERLGPIAKALGRDISRVSQLAGLGASLEASDRSFAKRVAAVRAALV